MRFLLVGAGYSSAQVFIRLVKRLQKKGISAEVVVVDPVLSSSEMWGRGVAWGYPIGHPKRRLEYLTNGLVQSLGANDDHERSFERWLEKNSHRWMEEMRVVAKRGNLEVQRWLEEHESTVLKGDLRFLYVPRAFFGDWVSERVALETENAELSGSTVRRVAEVVETISFDEDRKRYTVQLGNGESYISDAVALCTGSALAISNYLHGQEEKIQATLERNTGPVAIIGGSASALDAIRFMQSSEDRANRKLIIISPTGGFPPGGITTSEKPVYEPTDFQIGETRFESAAALLQWCQNQAVKGLELGYSMEAIHMGIRAIEDELRDALSEDEQYSYLLNQVNRILRRSTEDALKEVRALSDGGVLSFVRGRVKQIDDYEDRITLQIQNEDDEIETINVACCINTSGSPSFSTCLNNHDADNQNKHYSSMATLISQLVEDKLVALDAESGNIKTDEHCFTENTPKLGYIGPQRNTLGDKPSLFSAYSWGVLKKHAFAFVDELFER